MAIRNEKKRKDNKSDKKRTKIFELVLTLEEYNSIAKRAEEEGIPIADYLRWDIICDSLLSRNSEGWEIFSKRFTKETLPLFKILMESQDIEEKDKKFHLQRFAIE
ncbi:MAG TPA: hypothetical protein VHT73_08845 [Thermodesulfobacteriota bacterium]|nr:hypothetical protein [Thermodesulfobacteriota bacterium]